MSNPPTSIPEARAAIDQLDKIILKALQQRMAYSKIIGAFKQKEDLPINDPARESQLIQDLCEQNQESPLPDSVIATLWSEILSASKAVQ